ncbi:hotdog fold thioesterase [Antricoccus suffuscus]|uniref:hotdog fold thioesterase n=1 Tax=Antricoccus suffuscus TaxID=1629062 RepID=UPI00192D640E|nr:hotdog fold thioesterase [Antricoccus suffuscus]
MTYDDSHLAAMIAADRTARGLGVRLDSAAGGRAVVSMTVRADMLNGHGTCHGGFIFTLGDIALSYASNTRGALNVAAAADIQYVAPAAEGVVLRATAAERLRYGKAGRNGLYDVTIVDTANDTLVAIFTGRVVEVG